MKKLLILSVMILGSLASCHNDLEPEIYNIISPTLFPETESDVKSLVTGVYSNISTGTWGTIYSCGGSSGTTIWPELSTDIMDVEWGAYWIPLSNFGWNENNAEVTGTFNYYNTISKVTLTLDRIKDVPMNEDKMKTYVAELTCIRGWMSWILYDLYGPVPVATLEVLKNPLDEVILERPDNKTMVDLIAVDLRNAANSLPVVASEWGRCTKGTALMVLLKLYMHEKDWTNAETIAREIIALNQYALLPDYASIFTIENQKNKEIIHSFSCTLESGNMWHSHVLPPTYKTTNPNIQEWGGFRMRWSFFDTFEKIDKRLGVVLSEYMGKDGVYYDRNNPGSNLDKGPVPIKYGEDPTQIGYFSSIDMILFRYSDVLLSLAEAAANKNGAPTQECIDLINQVRTRAGLGNLMLADYSNITGFNNMILLERGHELFCEGGRRQDQIRHNTYIEFGNTIPGNQTAPYKVLFPLPQTIINEGKGKIIQNPGY